jgi:hypothetical protein
MTDYPFSVPLIMEFTVSASTQFQWEKKKICTDFALINDGLRGVWQGVPMDFLKFHPGPPRPYPSGVACLQGEQLAAVFYPLDTPHCTPVYDDGLVCLKTVCTPPIFFSCFGQFTLWS